MIPQFTVRAGRSTSNSNNSNNNMKKWMTIATGLVVVFAIMIQSNSVVLVDAFAPQHFGVPATTTSVLSRKIPTPTTTKFSQRRTQPSQSQIHQQKLQQRQRPLGDLFRLYMGRAAAVRAATKGKTDAAKAKTNAIYGKKIIMAVKQGGSPDPNANRALANVIKAAKANSVPVDNINRAIKRASEANAGDFSESTFEAYGLGGASFVINVLSDNANRATADVKSTVNKRNGKIAEQGSVLFMYDRKGKIEIKGESTIDEEQLLDVAIEAGVDDFVVEEGETNEEDSSTTTTVLVEPADCATMFDAIKEAGLAGDNDDAAKMSLAWISKAPVECTDEDFEKNMEIIEALEELDDVDSVEHNMSN